MESREHPRYPTDRLVEIKILDQPGEQSRARLSNLSASGARLLVERPLPLGAPLQINCDDLILLGEVCYCRPAGSLYAAGIKLEQCLTITEDLLRLAAQLRGEPQPAPSKEPS